MKRLSIIAAILAGFCLSACATSQKPNCAELEKACSQAQDICETLEENAPADDVVPIEAEELPPVGGQDCKKYGDFWVCSYDTTNYLVNYSAGLY